MTHTGGEVVAEALQQARVGHVFGVPGESYLGLLDALYSSRVSFVSTRHEGAAAFMASGYSKVSGEIGVCLGTRAVGTANLSIGIHNAHQDSTPMIAIAGQVNRSFRGREAFQEVDLVAAMTPFAKLAMEIPSADAAPEIIARAIAVATSGRPGPVFLSLPQDVCDEPTEQPCRQISRVVPPAPNHHAVLQIVEALNAARSPLIFAGGGALNSDGATEVLVAFAEAAEVPVITGWRHHDVFPNDHRLFLGCASLGADASVWQRLREADVVLVLGNRMQENGTDGYRYPSLESRLLQVDIEPAVMFNHRAPELAVQADVGSTLRELVDALATTPPHNASRRARNDADRKIFFDATQLPTPPAVSSGVSYEEILHGLAGCLEPDAIIASDAGNFYGWLSRYRRFSVPHTYVGPASGAMGYGLPAAIGAKLAQPRSTVVSVSGDGGFLMTVAELETAARLGAGIVAVVLDNRRHGTIRLHQETQHPGRIIGTELGATDLSLVARGLGVQGHRVERSGDFEPTLRAAIAAGQPTVVHVTMDREEISVQRRGEEFR